MTMTISAGDRVAYTVTYGVFNHITRRTGYGRVTSIRPDTGARREDRARIAVENPVPGRSRYVERYLADLRPAPAALLENSGNEEMADRARDQHL